MNKEKKAAPKPTRKIKPVGAGGHRGRMFQKLISTGGEALSPRDTLEMLLYFPIKLRDTRDAAVDLMNRFDDNIENILTASEKELCKTAGVGPSAASFLNLVGEIAKNSTPASPADRKADSVSTRVSEVFSELRGELHGDELWVVFLDNRTEIITSQRLKEEFDYPTESDLYRLLRESLRVHASSVIFAHVTGELTVYPTKRDAKFVKLMQNMLGATNLTLYDYYIVGGDEVLEIISLENPYSER